VASAGYSIEFDSTGSALHGKIDSNGTIKAAVEENIAGMMRLVLSGEAGIAPGDYKVGITLMYMGS
jgi:hypothetical protein